MSEEEKKAIEYTKLDIKITKEQLKNGDLFMSEKQERERINNLKIILNLIEKLQKELNQEKEKNKELKEKYSRKLVDFQKEREEYEKNYISKDKIKEKIEEIRKYKDLANKNIEERIIIADSDSLNYGLKAAHNKDIEILQDLLEE